MSAYIVSNKTISLIAQAFNDYDVKFCADDYDPKSAYIGGCSAFIDSSALTKGIGQSLLNQNYASVNARYSERTKAPEFVPEDVGDYITDLGAIIGCIDCYNYQACETELYECSDLYESLEMLKEKIYTVAMRRLGYADYPWGID